MPGNDVHALTAFWGPEARVRAGQVARRCLQWGHMSFHELDGMGPARTVEDHLEIVWRRWSRRHITAFDDDVLLLGLALDEEVGQHLLRKGLVHEHVARRLKSGADPVWDQLSRDGRALAENQPLLAAAYGAPPSWTATLPEPVRLAAFAPDGGRVAVLAGSDVYDVAPSSPPRHVGVLPDDVRSLGWGRDGIIALTAALDGFRVVDVATGASLGAIGRATGGVLAGGLPAWVTGPDGLRRWWGPAAPEDVLAADGEVLAVDDIGSHGLIGYGDGAVVLKAGDEPPPGPGDRPHRHRPGALVDLEDDVGVASVTKDRRVMVCDRGGRLIAEILTGSRPVGALASGGGGRCLAIAFGEELAVWPVSPAVTHAVAGYHPDNAGLDLLGADRDAAALAALIASKDLRPPLAVGVFGEWGSGKTFVLDRIVERLRELSWSRDRGFLEDIVVVPFNAWHYAETNLWASLVDQVLQAIRPSAGPSPRLSPAVTEAERLAAVASDEVAFLDAELATVEETIRHSAARLVRWRRTAWVTGGLVLVFAAAAVVAVAVGRSAAVFASLSAVTAVGGYLAAAAGQLISARGQAKEIASAGREGLAAVGRFSGRAAAARRADLLERVRVARGEQERLRALASEVRSDPMVAMLGLLPSVTEYRDQLSLVTRTRTLFTEMDDAFRGRKRVVVAIDDLDRCPAEKVVQVLEAVHLLFNFEMFVVVLAVDTRWLEESLRIRYHQLLGGDGDATPADYLEKIIQIPMRLPPLDAGLVRALMTGLTGVAAASPVLPQAAPAALRPAPPEPEASAMSFAVGTEPREQPRDRPGKLLATTPEEAAAMAAVAPLVGSTPRTVKRFVNTYRLIKARAKEPGDFDDRRDGIGDHEVVAFLLAVVTGQREYAGELLAALARAEGGTLRDAVSSPPVVAWLFTRETYASAPAHRFASWATEVARFSF
ncbi:P-loop NTPase fold protein [Paractinoplanes globisporus]|uniref:P-loop NTPase fold protein n=1 Tax=Paractinoplanes globisporus TaxID=113565 RepID=A0ABW6WT00_9ACTN|nr:P-loop NTPase fold protein [Actinoplanes globisporus]